MSSDGTMTVVDLGAIRRHREAIQTAATAVVDLDMARIVNRGIRRKLRAQMRRKAAELQVDQAGGEALLNQAVRVFDGRLKAMVEERESAKVAAIRAEILERPSLQAFVDTATLWIGGHTAGTVEPWLREFLQDYSAAVLGIAEQPRHTSTESPNRDAAVQSAFNDLMKNYRDDSRRAYLGSMFGALLGASVRQAFSDHVETLSLRYGLRSNS